MTIIATKAALGELKAYRINFDAVVQTHSDLLAEAAAKDGDPNVLGYTEVLYLLQKLLPERKDETQKKIDGWKDLTQPTWKAWSRTFVRGVAGIPRALAEGMGNLVVENAMWAVEQNRDLPNGPGKAFSTVACHVGGMVWDIPKGLVIGAANTFKLAREATFSDDPTLKANATVALLTLGLSLFGLKGFKLKLGPMVPPPTPQFAVATAGAGVEVSAGAGVASAAIRIPVPIPPPIFFSDAAGETAADRVETKLSGLEAEVGPTAEQALLDLVRGIRRANEDFVRTGAAKGNISGLLSEMIDSVRKAIDAGVPVDQVALWGERLISSLRKDITPPYGVPVTSQRISAVKRALGALIRGGRTSRQQLKDSVTIAFGSFLRKYPGHRLAGHMRQIIGEVEILSSTATAEEIAAFVARARGPVADYLQGQFSNLRIQLASIGTEPARLLVRRMDELVESARSGHSHFIPLFREARVIEGRGKALLMEPMQSRGTVTVTPMGTERRLKTPTSDEAFARSGGFGTPRPPLRVGPRGSRRGRYGE